MRDLDGVQVSDYVCTPTDSPADGVSVYPQVCKGNVKKISTKDKTGQANAEDDDMHVQYVCEPLCRYALKVIDPRPAGTNAVQFDVKQYNIKK